jgi:hypothetical protein
MLDHALAHSRFDKNGRPLLKPAAGRVSGMGLRSPLAHINMNAEHRHLTLMWIAVKS